MQAPHACMSLMQACASFNILRAGVKCIIYYEESRSVSTGLAWTMIYIFTFLPFVKQGGLSLLYDCLIRSDNCGRVPFLFRVGCVEASLGRSSIFHKRHWLVCVVFHAYVPYLVYCCWCAQVLILGVFVWQQLPPLMFVTIIYRMIFFRYTFAPAVFWLAYFWQEISDWWKLRARSILIGRYFPEKLWSVETSPPHFSDWSVLFLGILRDFRLVEAFAPTVFWLDNAFARNFWFGWKVYLDDTVCDIDEGGVAFFSVSRKDFCARDDF